MNYQYPRSQSISQFQYIIKRNNGSYNQNPTPGPGAYESKDSFVQINQDGMQVGIRGKNSTSPRGNSPGPAAYNANDKHLPSSPKWRLSKQY